MYQLSYVEQAADTPKECRDRERLALEHALTLLGKAEKAGVASREAIEALDFVTRLWSAFIQDLTDPENDLPDILRADLISIGLWIIRETASIRLGNSQNFRGIIDICATIRDGLK